MSTAVEDPEIAAIALRVMGTAQTLGALPSGRPTFRAYVERTKKIVCDLWQVDLADRLERSFWIAQAKKFEFQDLGTGLVYAPNGFAINKEDFYAKRGKGTHAAIHAPPQFGKSIIISQAYPAWILGWDPTHRFRLATYSILHSTRFSKVIRHLMESNEHRDMFPDPAGWIHPLSRKFGEWSTNARVEINDGQSSFTALGLKSGFVGTGFDTLLMDDPYKPLAADCPVPTPYGWSTMGELKVGDQVFDHSGKVCNVVRVTDRWVANRQRVWFSDGTFIDSHPNHLWKAFNRKSHAVYTNKKKTYSEDWWKWTTRGRARVDDVSTEDIAETLMVRGTMRNWTIPVALPLDIQDVGLPVDPYLLGYWLGDGSSHAGSFTVDKDDLPSFLSHVSAAGYCVHNIAEKKDNRARHVSISTITERGNRWNDSLTKRLTTLGVVRNKHVPGSYMRAGTSQRLALLRGLMDSDGSASREGEATFVNTNKTLAHQVQELIVSLGGKACFDKRQVGYAVRTFAPFQPFALPRKAARWRPDGQIRRVNRTIVKVEQLEETEHLCIEVDSPSHLFLAGRAMVPTCNSYAEAFSEVIRASTWGFYSDTAHPRWEEHSNEFIMFHRYHQDDMGGRAIATGYFELWRYAAVADSAYRDVTSGRDYPCLPLTRVEGEFLSPRRAASYYVDQQKNDQVWQSQFQGRPSALTGNFFNVLLLKTAYDSPELRARIIYWIRAWDNAATEGGGAFSAGVLMGIDAMGAVYVFHVARDQVNTAQRKMLQQTTAENDGEMIPVHGPEDPGSAGRDVAFEFREDLGQLGFNAMTTKVSGSKESRAYNYSKAVNSSNVHLVQCCEEWETCAHDTKWDHVAYKDELQHFPASTYKDQVDASADAYNYLRGVFYRGPVIRNFSSANLLPWNIFEAKFGDKIAPHWETMGAIRLAPDRSTPSGWALMTRAAEDARVGEMAFVVAAGRMHVDNALPLVDALRRAAQKHCARGIDQVRVVWIRTEGADVVVLTSVKHGLNLSRFEAEPVAGIPELNYYFEPLPTASPFDGVGLTSRLQLLIDPGQMQKASDDGGMLPIRQEVGSWAFNEKHEPQPFGGIVLDCLRMILYNFALTAPALTKEQKREAKLKEEHREENVLKKLGTDEFVSAYWARQAELRKQEIQEQNEKSATNGGFLGRRPMSRGRVR